MIPTLLTIQDTVSGTSVSEGVTNFLLSVKHSRKKLKDVFEERFAGVSHLEFFSPTGKYILKNFESYPP